MSLARRRLLPALVAALLLVQSGLAAAHCLARAAVPPVGTATTIICTADGLRHVVLPPPGDHEGGADEHGDGHAGFCAVCHALPAALLPEPPPAPFAPAPVAADAPAWTPAGPAAPRPPARAPPNAPRAPPAALA